jgi:SAM-dependent methyltransferase
MISDDNPWLQIPVTDYEAHMEAVGQSAALRELFSSIYWSVKPRRLAVLGCTTGADFDTMDPAVTDVATGVDINECYLDVAAERLTATGRHINLVCGDVLEVELSEASFDLVHAALLLEYLDPVALFRRVHQWLAPSGRFSVIIQEPLPGIAAVSGTAYHSLQALSSTMFLRSAREVVSVGEREALVCESSRALELASGKVLTQLLFKRAISDQPGA